MKLKPRKFMEVEAGGTMVARSDSGIWCNFLLESAVVND